MIGSSRARKEWSRDSVKVSVSRNGQLLSSPCWDVHVTAVTSPGRHHCIRCLPSSWSAQPLPSAPPADGMQRRLAPDVLPGHRSVRPWTLMPWLQRVVLCADDADRAEQWTPRSRSCNECHRSAAIYVCRARTRDILDMVSVIYCRQQRQHRSSTLWTRVVAAGPHVRPRSNQLHDIHRIQTACAKVYRPGGFSERPNAPGELRPWQSWRHLFVRRTGTLEEKLERGMS